MLRVSRHALVDDILRALRRLGTQAPCSQVIRLVYSWHEAVFCQPYYQEMINPERGGVPRWQKEIEYARLRAVHEGLVLRPGASGRGIWELTPKAIAATRQYIRSPLHRRHHVEF